MSGKGEAQATPDAKPHVKWLPVLLPFVALTLLGILTFLGGGSAVVCAIAAAGGFFAGVFTLHFSREELL